MTTIFFSLLFALNLLAQEEGAEASSSSVGSAEVVPVTTLPLYLDVSMQLAMTSLDGATASTAPSGMQTGFSITPAFLFGRFLLGGTISYRSFSQSSSLSSTDGNLSGSRTYLSPTLGFSMADFLFKLQLHVAGKFNVSSNTASGAKVRYLNPSGFSTDILYQWLPSVFAGLSYETVSFSRRSQSNLNSDQTLSPAFKQSGIGVTALYVF